MVAITATYMAPLYDDLPAAIAADRAMVGKLAESWALDRVVIRVPSSFETLRAPLLREPDQVLLGSGESV